MQINRDITNFIPTKPTNHPTMPIFVAIEYIKCGKLYFAIYSMDDIIFFFTMVYFTGFSVGEVGVHNGRECVD